MTQLRQQLEILLLLIAIVAGLLVGTSIASLSLGAIAVIGAVAAFVVTDRLKLLRLDGWLANVASLVMLYFVLRDFYAGDQTQKLESVARMLVYLQTILLFQPKTPRVVWQVLILSLLQVVIAAIFALDFETSVLFLLYFLLAGVAMMLQTIYCSQKSVLFCNERGKQRQAEFLAVGAPLETLASASSVSPHPIAMQELPPGSRFITSNRVVQYASWLVLSAVFASIAFCVLPRYASPWHGPAVHEVATAGMMTAVDLEQRGKVRLSKEIVFRAGFNDFMTGEPVKDLGSPYFRAIAFSKIHIKNGKTAFTAPYDRVYATEVYQDLPEYRGRGRLVRQSITLEKTKDPLVYEVMPVFRVRETPDELQFCHELSAYTRCREEEQISFAPFRYETATLRNHQGRLMSSWPYVSNSLNHTDRPLSLDPMYQEWLVQIQPDRYPGLVQIASQIAAEHEDDGRLALAVSMMRYFHQPGRFQYTLNFDTVSMQEDVDPIEDFFSNHRRGHCELYAAALTLMLRSQGIPARLVVGFCGGEYNTLTNEFFVRGTDAHAWVEVYLRPDDCTDQMRFDGAAGRGGAWKRLDPTPLGSNPGEVVGRGSAIELARTVWQDYVLGMDGNQSDGATDSVPDSLVRFLEQFDIEQIDQRIADVQRMIRSPQSRWIAVLFVFGLVGLRFLIAFLWNYLTSYLRARSRAGGIRSFVADAIAMIAPKLGQWVRGEDSAARSTLFYRDLTQLLARHGLQRTDRQTHRAFATAVATRTADHRYGQSIGRMVCELTDHFNAVRFGHRILDELTRLQIEQQLSSIELALEEAPLAES